MKKHLLILSFILAANLTFGQWTVYPAAGTPKTGLSFDGETQGASGTAGYWGSFVPAHTDAACTSAGAAGGISFIPGAASSGEIGFGIGAVTNGYQDFGGGCVAVPANVGFTSSTVAGGFTGANGIDINLTATANQRIKFMYKSDQAFTVNFQMADQYGNEQLSATPINFLGDNAWHSVDLDFSSTVIDANNLAAMRVFSFQYDNATPLTANIYFSDLSIGSGVVAGTKDKSSIISDSKLFPNPATNTARVELNLKSTSEVKVTLTNMLGKEVAVIADETTASLDKSFSVAGLVQGVYTVNYYIDGQPSKSELLMVK